MGQGSVGILEAESQFRAGVAPLPGIDAPQVPHPLAMFGVFAHGDVDQPLMDHRGADDVVAIGPATEGVFRFLGIAIELPEQFRLAIVPTGIEGVEPAIATAKEHLGHAVDFRIGGARPLSMEHVRSG